jgi:hypothetical protein
MKIRSFFPSLLSVGTNRSSATGLTQHSLMRFDGYFILWITSLFVQIRKRALSISMEKKEHFTTYRTNKTGVAYLIVAFFNEC